MRGGRLAIALLLSILSTPARADALLTIRPLPRAIAADARVAKIEAEVSGEAGRALTASDAAEQVTLFARTIERVGLRRAALLPGTRALHLRLTIDRLEVADVGSAFFTAPDRIGGLAEYLDPAGGEPLGLFYVTVENRHGGLLGLALRGTRVRETLAKELVNEALQPLKTSRRSPK